MKNLENMQSKETHIITTEAVIKNQVKDLIHVKMDAGKASKKEAWSMAEILNDVSVRFGRNMETYAREYIVQLCMKK